MAKIAVITPVKHLDGVVELLQSKGDVVFYETSTKEEVRELLSQTAIDTLVCNPNQQTYKIDKELLEDTKVKLINSCSTGLNHIDLEYCKENNIEIQCHKNDFNLINQLPSTSELAFGLMLSLLRQIPQGQKHVSEYKWDYTQFMGRQVKGLKVGIVGYGRLGKMMYDFCKAFGADVMIYDPYVRDQLSDRFLLNNWCSSLEQLFEFSDVVNTSRGEIVNELDIAVGLKTNIITGYATDVIENEFDDLTKSPIIDAMNTGENIIITPHVGGMTIEGQTKAYKHSINKI